MSGDGASAAQRVAAVGTVALSLVTAGYQFNKAEVAERRSEINLHLNNLKLQQSEDDLRRSKEAVRTSRAELNNLLDFREADLNLREAALLARERQPAVRPPRSGSAIARAPAAAPVPPPVIALPALVAAAPPAPAPAPAAAPAGPAVVAAAPAPEPPAKPGGPLVLWTGKVKYGPGYRIHDTLVLRMKAMTAISGDFEILEGNKVIRVVNDLKESGFVDFPHKGKRFSLALFHVDSSQRATRLVLSELAPQR